MNKDTIPSYFKYWGKAFSTVAPVGGEIYSETPGKVRSLKVRDVPLIHQPRQFASRLVYAYGGDYVPE